MRASSAHFVSMDKLDSNVVKANTHFKRAALWLALGTASFAIGTGMLFHEHTHNRRIGIYWLSDACLALATLVFAPLALNSFNQGVSSLKNHTPPQRLHNVISDFITDREEVKKPFMGLASRVYKASAVVAGLSGLATSLFGVIDENIRLHKGLDHDVTAYTMELLVAGGLLTTAAITLSVIAAYQKVWEIKHPGYNAPENTHSSQQQGCMRRVCIDPTRLCPV